MSKPLPLYKIGQKVEFLKYYSASDASNKFVEGDRVIIKAITECINDAGEFNVYSYDVISEDNLTSETLFEDEIKPLEDNIVAVTPPLEGEVQVSKPILNQPTTNPSALNTNLDINLNSLIKGTPIETLNAAANLIDDINEKFFILGGILSYIHQKKVYVVLGEEYNNLAGFTKYVEDSLGLKYGKAMAYINIYNTYTQLGLEAKQVTEIGWSKARAISPYVTTENFSQIVSYAEQNTRDDLITYCKENYVNVKTGKKDQLTDRMVQRKFTFFLFDEQAKLVDLAIQEKVGSLQQDSDKPVNPSDALFDIIAEWSSSQNQFNKNAVTLEDDIAEIEARYNVVLEVKNN